MESGAEPSTGFGADRATGFGMEFGEFEEGKRPVAVLLVRRLRIRARGCGPVENSRTAPGERGAVVRNPRRAPRPARLRGRLAVSGWSPLEHGCRVRDMCLLFRHRPPGAPERAAHRGPDGPGSPPHREEPRRVAPEAVGAAGAPAAELGRPTDAERGGGNAGFPAAGPTVGLSARSLVHDIVHNLSVVLNSSGNAAAHRRGGISP